MNGSDVSLAINIPLFKFKSLENTAGVLLEQVFVYRVLVLESRQDDRLLVMCTLWWIKDIEQKRRIWISEPFLIIKLFEIDMIHIMEIPHVEVVSLNEAKVLFLANRQL